MHLPKEVISKKNKYSKISLEHLSLITPVTLEGTKNKKISAYDKLNTTIIFFVLTVLVCSCGNNKDSNAQTKNDTTSNTVLKADFYYNRGIENAKLKDFLGAIQDYNKAIELNPNDYIFYYNRGNAKFKMNIFHDAIQDFNKSIELNDNHSSSYNNRGLAKARLEDYRGAISDYDKAILLDASDAEAYYNRGLSKLMLKDKNSGCLDLSKAGELGETDAYAVIKQLCN